MQNQDSPHEPTSADELALDTRYTTLIDALDEAYCVIEMIFDSQGHPTDYRFIDTNAKFEQQTGLANAKGKLMRDLAGGHEAHWFEIYGKVALTGKSVRFIQRAEALGRWFDLHAFRIGNNERYVGVLFRDITERRRGEAALRANEIRQAYLLSLTDALRPLRDPHEIQVTALRVLGQHLSVSRALYADVVCEDGRDVYAISHVYCRPGVPPLAARHRADDFGELLFGELRAGRTLIIRDTYNEPMLSERERAMYAALGVRSLVIVPLVKQGNHVGLVAVQAEDARSWTSLETSLVEQTTERTWAAVEQARAEQALLKSEERLREADVRKDEFLATLAHELRNPLATIRTSLHLLSDEYRVDTSKVQDMLARQVTHMVRLIDDLMEVSRISRGAIELKRRPMDLNGAVRDIMDASAQALEKAGHRKEIHLTDDPILVDADPVRLGQILSNLLSNAIRYTDAGGVIEVRTWRDSSVAHVSVRDTGIGIAAAKLPGIFTMFGQIDRGAVRSQGGLGIGLALAQRLARMHGGDIEVSSLGTGHGSTFTVHLPLAWSSADSASTGTLAAPIAATQPDQKRVLVVDDNEDSAEATGMLLEAFGADVKVVHSGPDGLAAMESWQPQLVLLDIGMPDMDGHEVAKRIRAQPRWESTTLVALTGWGQKADIDRTRQSGFDQHLVKPASADDLKSLLGQPGRSPA